MRLLQLGPRNKLSLTNYDGDKLSPYAILSHTWGANSEEVTFEDVKQGIGKSKAGYAKIIFCGQQAQKDDLKHFWVDSCCINKSSDAELSESLNSMFRWYAGASKCYVYLQDVSVRKRDSDGQVLYNWEAAFRNSRWFTRGCMLIERTLQELLAPRVVEFWSRDGSPLGTKENLQNLISSITEIPPAALWGRPLSQYTVNDRLRWASNRSTKKKEDRAYCLLGMFGVFLSPIYGEGENALTRLKQEIAKTMQRDPATLGIFRANAQGDRFVAISTEEAIQQQHVQRRQHLLASLSFDQIDTRQSTIKDAQRSTCEWILQHPNYVSWTDRNKPPRQQEILWIAGKPGAGKSTIMKFAYSRAKKAKLQDEIILSFFFNARGDDLEQTTVGMYRSLLVQLLNEAPDLQTVLDDVHSPSPTEDQSVVWTYDLLQNLLRTAVEKLGTRRLKLFIDALDECDEQQVRDMVEFLEYLAESILGDHSRLYICFASRHYPTINLNDGLRLVLENQAGHAEDLQKYIQRRLETGKGRLSGEIQAQVQEKSQGVFMWVVLVVDILNTEIRRGRIFAVKQRLQEIPAELKDLFKDLLRRDNVNMHDLLLCIQWILFARRPLSRVEFYFAMTAGLQQGSNWGVDWQPDLWDPEVVTDDAMNRFVLNSSKGLAELTKSRSKPTVQFIHETVRDFLLKDGGLYEIWPELDGKLNSYSHERLKNCCLDYMAADLSSCVSLPESLPKASSKEAKESRQQISLKFPFLEYASKHVLYHANEAACDVAQEGFLNLFPLNVWILNNNIYEPREKRRHSPDATLCYVAAETNLSKLLEALKSDDAWLRCRGDRYQFPAIAAFANGHRDALQVLFGDDNTAFVNEITKDDGFGKPSDLPQTVQDSIFSCKQLSIRYLWIDCMCIIQDPGNPVDWRKQASLMDKVYTHSHVNLSALAAENTESSMFWPRDSLTFDGHVTSSIAKEFGRRIWPQRYRIINIGLWDQDVTRSHLNARAWVLQERVLSPRILHFGFGQMFWECCMEQASEGFPTGLPSFMKADQRYNLKNLDPGAQVHDYTGWSDEPGVYLDLNPGMYQIWVRIVEEYSKCKLTKSSDKLVALSGLAKRVRSMVNDEYVAGMWCRYLPIQLFRRTSRSTTGCPPRPTQYRAPSFSWAALDAEIEMPILSKIEVVLAPEILDVDLNYASNDHFGAITEGHLTVRSILQRVSFLRVPPDPEHTVPEPPYGPNAKIPETILGLRIIRLDGYEHDGTPSEIGTPREVMGHNFDEDGTYFDPYHRADLYCIPRGPVPWALRWPTGPLTFEVLILQLVDREKARYARRGVCKLCEYPDSNDKRLADELKAPPGHPSLHHPCLAYDGGKHTIRLV